MIVDSLKVIQFDIFKPYQSLIHAFSTRLGGYSKKPYDSLNLGLTTGDNPHSVQKNRKIFFNHLCIPQEKLVFPVQTHSSNSQIVNSPGIINNCDALITNTPNLFLTIQTADCFPVFVYNPVTQTAAIIHSGWKGAAANICGKTILKMKEIFNIKPTNLIVAMGPGVQMRNFQVDDPVYIHFDKKYFIADGLNHYKMNLQQAIFDQLQDSGISEKNIECCTDCTFDKSDLYYSYRRDKEKSGRMMGVIGIKA
jgi:YfiH family protein